MIAIASADSGTSCSSLRFIRSGGTVQTAAVEVDLTPQHAAHLARPAGGQDHHFERHRGDGRFSGPKPRHEGWRLRPFERRMMRLGSGRPLRLKDMLEHAPRRRVVALPPSMRLGVVEHRLDVPEQAARRVGVAAVPGVPHDGLDVVVPMSSTERLAMRLQSTVRCLVQSSSDDVLPSLALARQFLRRAAISSSAASAKVLRFCRAAVALRFSSLGSRPLARLAICRSRNSRACLSGTSTALPRPISVALPPRT